MAWTIADIWEAVAKAQPEQPALIQGERVVTWAEFDARSDALAAHFIAKGLGHQAKMAATRSQMTATRPQMSAKKARQAADVGQEGQAGRR